jgi:hypothetical protein
VTFELIYGLLGISGAASKTKRLAECSLHCWASCLLIIIKKPHIIHAREKTKHGQRSRCSPSAGVRTVGQRSAATQKSPPHEVEVWSGQRNSIEEEQQRAAPGRVEFWCCGTPVGC